MRRPFLSGRLVYLRPLQPDDAEHFTEWLNDSRVTRTLRPRGPVTLESEQAWIERATHDPASLVCALVRRRDDRLIGTAGFHGIDTQARLAEYGIHIGIPAMWGKGYGTECTRLLLEHAFRTMNLHRVWLRTHADNLGGLRAYEKAGFRVEGVWRDAVYREGVYKDMVLMGILRPEWERLAGTPARGRTRSRTGAVTRPVARR